MYMYIKLTTSMIHATSISYFLARNTIAGYQLEFIPERYYNRISSSGGLTACIALLHVDVHSHSLSTSKRDRC